MSSSSWGLGIELTLQLPERGESGRIEAAVLGRRGHGAARLRGVPAIAEVAAGRERVDVGEGVIEAAFPELHLAHARGVDEQPATRQLEQLAMRGGVAAAGIGDTDFGGPLPFVAAQAVDQRRLADAG